MRASTVASHDTTVTNTAFTFNRLSLYTASGRAFSDWVGRFLFLYLGPSHFIGFVATAIEHIW